MEVVQGALEISGISRLKEKNSLFFVLTTQSSNKFHQPAINVAPGAECSNKDYNIWFQLQLCQPIAAGALYIGISFIIFL